MSFELIPGTICATGGRVIEVDGQDSLTHIRARDAATGEMLSVPISKIEKLPARTNSLPAAIVAESEWKRCAAIAKDLFGLVALNRVPRKVFEQISQHHGLSIRHVQRLLERFRKNPRTTALVRDRGGRRPGTNRLDSRVDAVINHAIQKYYLRRERPSGSDLVERIRSLCRRLDLPQPSRSAVIRRVRAQEGYESDRRRHGTKSAKQVWEPRPSRLISTRPLELIEIDHTRVDAMVLSDDRDRVLGRPWLSVAIDVATRAVLGMYLSMDAPSAVSVSLCIEHSVLPKVENETSPGIWPMYGKPERILVDNGKDFRSMALSRGCEEHGITLEWRPIRTPHYGAHIERLIGTLMKIAHLLPGTTFSNPKERGDYNSERKARFTLEELRQWLTHKICWLYHVRRHRSLGISPLLAWERSLTTAAGPSMPPALVANSLEFRMDFLPYAFRPIRRTGIQLRCTRYWHEDLQPMINRTEPTMVRYDPRDPSRVWVRRPDSVLVEAKAVAGIGAGDLFHNRFVDPVTQQRLDAAIDLGFERCDAIERAAEKSTRAARSARSPTRRRNHNENSSQVDCLGQLSPMISADRSEITVEEWD